MFPDGLEISRPAPIAATFGSSSIYTFLAPHLKATSWMALFSIEVMLDGQQIKIVGLAKIPFKFSLLIKCVSKISVVWKSAKHHPLMDGLLLIFQESFQAFLLLLHQQQQVYLFLH